MRTGTFFALVFCAVVGFAFMQIAEVMHQYVQRIGGTTDELARIVRFFNDDAARSGYSAHTALEVLKKNPERLVRDQGFRMQDNFDRYERLARQRLALGDGVTLGALFAFMTDYDTQLLKSTLAGFIPAFPISAIGIFCFFVGFLVGGLFVLYFGAARELFRSPAEA